MKEIQNPILKGFNPDPSIIRVGEDYYIATSTFEWFPGVQIHHSKDLMHWRLLTRPLNRATQLDLRGIPNKGGVWAPCLSFDKGVFYLVYTVVYGHQGIFKDLDNYLVTAKDIMGPWSNPIYLNSTGFDPSLFHDEDGRKWLLNMNWDIRKGHSKFGGILLQEYDATAQKLTGPIQNIYQGTPLGTTEGPHLYRHDGRYYLITAEGGTGYHHAVSMARADNLTGPYENDPLGPILTVRECPDYPIQKAGHADIVETPDHEWVMVHLGSRPFEHTQECILGRETFIERVYWTPDGWLRLAQESILPQMEVPAFLLPEHPFEAPPVRDDFDGEELPMDFQTLYAPLGEDALSLTARKGFLRLTGGASFACREAQSLIARRQQSFHYTAETQVDFNPPSYRQMAGLICLHDVENFIYLRISRDETQKVLGIMTCDNGAYSYPAEDIALSDGPVKLRVEVMHRLIQFYFKDGNQEWFPIGPVFDAVLLTDDHSRANSYTGAFVGLCCQDLAKSGCVADFDYFEYVEG